MKINPYAPVVCVKEVLIDAPRDLIFKLLTEIELWPVWQKNIYESKIINENNGFPVFVWKSSGVKIKSEFHSALPEMVGWSGNFMGILAIHNWYLKPEDLKTRLLVEQSMNGILVWFFRKRAQKAVDRAIESWINFLKCTAES